MRNGAKATLQSTSWEKKAVSSLQQNSTPSKAFRGRQSSWPKRRLAELSEAGQGYYLGKSVLERNVIVLKALLFRTGLAITATVCWLALPSTASRFLFPVRPVHARVPVSSEQHDVIGYYFGDVSLHSLVVVVRPGLYASSTYSLAPLVKYAARRSFFQSTT